MIGRPLGQEMDRDEHASDLLIAACERETDKSEEEREKVSRGGAGEVNNRDETAVSFLLCSYSLSVLSSLSLAL